MTPFHLFILLEPPSSSSQIRLKVFCYTILSPLLYSNAYFTPSIHKLLHIAPTCRCTPFYPIVPTAHWLPISLASGSLVNGLLSPAKVLAVISLPHLPDPVFSGCTPPCPWRLRGEGYWISHIATDIRALTKPHVSKYYQFSLLISSGDRLCCAATAFVTRITPTEYTIGVKTCLQSRQGWR